MNTNKAEEFDFDDFLDNNRIQTPEGQETYVAECAWNAAIASFVNHLKNKSGGGEKVDKSDISDTQNKLQTYE